MAYNPSTNIVVSGKTFTDVPSVQFKTPDGSTVNFAHVGGQIRFSPTLKEQTQDVANYEDVIIDPITNTLLNQLDSDFIAQNIKKGVNLFGLVGTLEASTGTGTGTGSGVREPYIEEVYDSSNRLINAALHGHKKIRDYAFYYCTNLKSVIIPNSVMSIGNNAFYGCASLTSATIPNSVTSIGGSVFQNCSSLTSMTIPNSVTSLGNYIFSGCSRLTSVTLSNNITSIKNYTFYRCTSLKSITIPDSITSIGGSAFQNCTSLTSMTIPASVMSIEGNVFYNCTGMTSVTFKGTPRSISSGVFSNCSALNTINVPWSQGTVLGAPWGATNATINYNYTGA